MEENKKEKGAFSFLRSLGFLGKDKKNTASAPNQNQKQPKNEPKKNVFYVGNVQEDLKKKKKLLEEIE